MATTADSPSSPQIPGGGESINSPQFRRKNLSPAWAQVVRGESESISAVHHHHQTQLSVSQPELAAPLSDSSPPKMASPSPPPDAGEGSDGGNDGNAARPKKLAWKKPSNAPSNGGVVEVSPVMGAFSWPALSESTKASPKSSADSTSKTLSDSSLSSSQGPVVPHSPKKQVTTTTNAAGNSNSNANHPLPTRQRSMKRGGGGGGNNRSGPSQSGFTHPHPPPPPPTPPPFPVYQIPQNGYPNMVQAVPDPSHREFPYRGSNWENRPAGGYVSPSHSVNDHRNPSRRGNFGNHQRGDGSYHNNHGEFYYIPQLPVEPYSHRPIIPHPPPLYIPVPEPLPVLLLKQIDYYFSDANLVKDDYLRSNMDDQGWVPIALIASFPRVRSLTTNVQLVLDSLRTSTIVEVQDDKVRRRNEWNKWIPASSRIPSDSGSVSPNKSSYDTLATSLQKITVEEVDTNQSSMTGKADPNSEAAAGSCITESIGQSQLPNGEDTQNTDSSGN
ncbi:la-related protein 1c [Quercus suber]|uniref:La-related protein 1c n=1 Tax=Quercus suber TaxID=58331 RepID=A0AAW0LX98_QUESU